MFKPELRRRAAMHVFSETVRSIADDSMQPEVQVGSHAAHGTLVSVTLSRVHPDRDAETEHNIHNTLGRFTHAHEIRWRD